jgi:branched-chain amino acid transport system substrate-binding protein
MRWSIGGAVSGSRHDKRRRWAAFVFAAGLAMSACSVSTPRHGVTVAAGGGGSRTGGVGIAAETAAETASGAAAGEAGGAAVGADTASRNGASGDWGNGASGDDPGGGVSVGVTDSTITLSSVGSFSGPYAAIYEQGYRAATLTWRDEVNANGGINGRKIEIKKVDDHFSVEGAVAACKEIESNGSFAAFTRSLFDNGLACLDAAGIPSVQQGISSPNPDGLGWHSIRSMFSAHGQGGALARFVVSPQGLNRGGHKLGIIYADDTPAIRSAADAFIAEAQAHGAEVHAEKIATNQASFTAQLQRLRDAGVDTVAMACVFESVGILRDAKAIAFNPVWTGYLFNADEAAAAGAQLFQGIKAPRPWVGADSPAFQAYKQKVATYGETTAPTTTNIASYAALLVMQRALELAGRNLTREGFLAAYDQIQNFDSGGYPPVSYSPGHIVGTEATFPLVCCNPDNTWKSDGPSSDFR